MRSALLALVLIPLGGSACTPAPEPLPIQNGFTAKQHRPYFPIEDGDKHALGAPAKQLEEGTIITCDNCHAGTKDFTQFRCLTCHSFDRPGDGVQMSEISSAHGLVPTFVRNDLACKACHEMGQVPGLSDLPPGWDNSGEGEGEEGEGEEGEGEGEGEGTGQHLAFSIYELDASHYIDGDQANAQTPYEARATQFDSAVTQCNTCHLNNSLTENRCAECHALDANPLLTVHTQWPNLERTYPPAATTIDCKTCHADAPQPAKMQQNPHDNAFPSNHHNAPTCNSCHYTQRTDARAYAINWNVNKCTCCHAAGCTAPDNNCNGNGATNIKGGANCVDGVD